MCVIRICMSAKYNRRLPAISEHISANCATINHSKWIASTGWVAGLLLIVWITAWIALSAVAQAQSPDERYTASRDALLADIANPAASFAFAEAAIEVGDIRGAISALERILLLQPELTNIKLELGLLYLRSGAPAVAETFLQEVVEAPETPPTERGRAETLLADAQAAQATHRITGQLDLAMRYETNANAAPTEVRFNGVGIPVTNQSDIAAPDVSGLGSLSLTHEYDLGYEEGHTFETTFSAFGIEYKDTPASNIGFVGIETGPDLKFNVADTPMGFRPYVGAQTLFVERTQFRNSGVLGALLDAEVTPRTRVAFGAEGRLNDFIDSPENPTAETQSGNELLTNLRVTHEVYPGLFVAGQVFRNRFNANEDFETYDALGAAASISYFFDNPGDPTLDPAVVRLSGAWQRRDYDKPNPIIDPNTTQKDDRYDVRLGTVVPFSKDLAATFSLTYTDNQSTLPNDSFDNFRVSVGVRYNFSVLP